MVAGIYKLNQGKVIIIQDSSRHTQAKIIQINVAIYHILKRSYQY